MHTYEVLYIIQADLDEAATTAVIEKINGWITESKGTVAKVDRWGKRHMAYAIRKQREGYYVLVTAEMAPTFVTELERNLRLNEPVLRHLITKVE
jgi:small subunit ribosomal protein S6